MQRGLYHKKKELNLFSLFFILKFNEIDLMILYRLKQERAVIFHQVHYESTIFYLLH